MTFRASTTAELKFNPLEDGAPADIVPASWNAAHVGVRLADAFRTLIALPGAPLRKASGLWPAYCYEWEDLLAQQEQEADEKARNTAMANRVRSVPSIEAIGRMERAIYWPAHYLRDRELARATNAVAFAIAIERDVTWVARKRGGRARIWQQNYWNGCEVIAWRLKLDSVAVF